MNHNLQLLQSLYLSASGKYRKYKTRLDKAVHTGRFYKLNKRKQSYLVSRLRRLYEKLKSLQTQLRIAGAGTALTLTLAIANPAQSQSTLGPFVKNDALNPLPPPLVTPHPRPSVADIDNDGDLDVFVGTPDGHIKFYRNDSPENKVTRFTELTGTDNPLDGVDVTYDAAPALADIDGDGDFDLLIGNVYGTTYFFRNTGSATNPVFTQQTGASNPFDGITGTTNKYGTSQALPVFVDFDGDSDIDLFIGSSHRYDVETGSHPSIEYYKNTGGAFSQEPTIPLGGVLEYHSRVSLTFTDIDGDGASDAIVGSSESGYIQCFIRGVEDVFTEQTGTWDPVTKTGNPFNGFYGFKYGAPVVADFDQDGDVDFLVGIQVNYYSDDRPTVVYFENTDGDFTLERKDNLNLSPFGGVDVGDEATPVFVDLDGDGDLDAVLGEKYGGALSVFLNTDGRFYADPEHPLTDILEPLSQTYDVVPVFADIDNDGDQDLFASMDTRISFFRNDDGVFTFEASPIDPPSTYNMSLAFIDVDNDGDLDALVGNDSYSGGTDIDYFQNNGNPSVPNFASAAAPAPFDATSFDRNPTLFAVDIDHDGDTDLIVTDTYDTGSSGYGYYYSSRTLYYENNGDGTFTESNEPLLEEINPQSFTSYADIDGDGDLDGFIGIGSYQDDGKVSFFENTNPEPLTSTEITEIFVVGGSPVIIAPNLTITDEDNDDITYATVSISDFVPGSEVLGFTPQSGITGEFDDELGVLTFIGKASIDTYVTLLRSVTIDFTGTVPNARKSKAARELDLIQSITFQVRDTDFTLTTVAVVSISIVPGNELTIYNAVSPNKSDDLNSFLRIAAIETISPQNTVTIYNRWGDVVFEVKDYNNSDPSKRFEGVNKNGKDLPSGTYFYKIEITGKTVTGYLSLKR